MAQPHENADDKKFNETLKRMLKTPPKPHEKAAKDKPKAEPKRKTTEKQRTQQN